MGNIAKYRRRCGHCGGHGMMRDMSNGHFTPCTHCNAYEEVYLPKQNVYNNLTKLEREGYIGYDKTQSSFNDYLRKSMPPDTHSVVEMHSNLIRYMAETELEPCNFLLKESDLEIRHSLTSHILEMGLNNGLTVFPVIEASSVTDFMYGNFTLYEFTKKDLYETDILIVTITVSDISKSIKELRTLIKARTMKRRSTFVVIDDNVYRVIKANQSKDGIYKTFISTTRDHTKYESKHYAEGFLSRWL